jgi:hypothetical protein
MTFQFTQRKPTTSYTKATQKINSRTMTDTTSPVQIYTKNGTIPRKSNKQTYDNYMETYTKTNRQPKSNS